MVEADRSGGGGCRCGVVDVVVIRRVSGAAVTVFRRHAPAAGQTRFWYLVVAGAGIVVRVVAADVAALRGGGVGWPPGATKGLGSASARALGARESVGVLVTKKNFDVARLANEAPKSALWVVVLRFRLFAPHALATELFELFFLERRSREPGRLAGGLGLHRSPFRRSLLLRAAPSSPTGCRR